VISEHERARQDDPTSVNQCCRSPLQACPVAAIGFWLTFVDFPPNCTAECLGGRGSRRAERWYLEAQQELRPPGSVF